MNRTYEELTIDFEKAAQRLGEDRGVTISAHHLRRLASGDHDRTPHPCTCRVLEAMFGRPVSELLRPWQGTPAEPARGLVLADAQTTRDIVAMAARHARDFAFLPLASPPGEVMSYVHDEVRSLATGYSRQPVPEFIGRLAVVQAALFDWLKQRQSPDHARELYFLAGVTGGMLARAGHDLAEPDAALAQAGTAFICADRAGHDGLKAWIRAVQCMINYWADAPDRAIASAASARKFTRLSGSTVAVWVPAVEARAWARLGNTAKVIELIREAESERESVRNDDLDDLGGICTYGATRQAYCHADALAWLPEQAKACQQYALQAIEGYRDSSAADWSFSFEAGSRADLAIGRIRCGEPDGAAEAIRPVLALPSGQRTNPILKSAQRVRVALETTPPAACTRALTDEINAFTKAQTRGATH
jgi:hypothetical protein